MTKNLYEKTMQYNPKSESKPNNKVERQSLEYSLIPELQIASSRISELDDYTVLMGDCGSCPSCSCISADFQALAVIEAPATVPIMVAVGAANVVSS